MMIDCVVCALRGGACVTTFVVALATPLVATSAQQQTSAPAQTLPGGASQVQETHGDWRVICAQQDDKKACVFSQQIADKGSRQLVLGVELKATKEGTAEGNLVMPFGLAVDQPITLQVDDAGARMTARFKTCVPIGCLVTLSLDKPAIDALKKGTALNVKATVSDSGQEAAFKLSLRGFGSAFDRAKMLSR
jgi:invasion protein IalB